MRLFAAVTFFSLLAFHLPAQMVLPPGFALTTLTTALNKPTSVAFSADGRIFIAEQGGRLRTIRDNVLLPGFAIRLNVDSAGERGLVGVQTHPDFPQTPYIYLYYTVPGGPAPLKPHNRVSRFTLQGDMLDPISEFILLNLQDLGSNQNHNGGALTFAKDGTLLIAIGDGGSSARAQNPDVLFGKLLRINQDGSVPVDNPFAQSTQLRKYLWSYGLRNPFTVSIYPETGRLFINDVGQSAFEEINDATRGGENFGWPLAEGISTDTTFVNPLYNYAHGVGLNVGCAITGGTFFYPSQTEYPSTFFNKYFFQDYCQKWIAFIDHNSLSPVATIFASKIGGNNLALAAGPDGKLYFLNRTNNSLNRLDYTLLSPPFVTHQPKRTTVLEGQPAHFSVHVIGSGPLAYQWKKDNVDIPGANAAELDVPPVAAGDSALYKVVITNVAGQVTSDEVRLSIIEVYTPPDVEIPDPPDPEYSAGDTISVDGLASDKQEGPLDDSIAWTVEYLTPSAGRTVHTQAGKTLVFNIPADTDIDVNGLYRLTATVTDSTGLIGTAEIELHPLLISAHIETEPPGLIVNLDGTPTQDVELVKGSHHTISFDSLQQLDNRSYVFDHWSTPVSSTLVAAESLSLTAHFAAVLSIEEDGIASNTVYPNPASGTIAHLNLTADGNTTAEIDIVTVTGQRLLKSQVDLHRGKNAIELPIAQLSDGLYMLRVHDESRIRTFKLVVKR